MLFQSFHAEVHQYRARIDEFNSLTQELISAYPNDEAGKVKKLTEGINQRWGLVILGFRGFRKVLGNIQSWE